MNERRNAVWCAAAAAVGLPAEASAEAPFSTSVETDAGSGLAIVVLRGPEIEARVAPEVGGNLFSLRFAGEEILVQPEKLADLKQNRSGTPILFPMPNRVRDASFTFEGRAFGFEANNGKNFIHGLVRQRPWQRGEPRAAATNASVEVWIDWNEGQPDFARFPLEHRLTVTYTLGRDGVRIAYRVENRSPQRLPFGFGLHPWFRVPGDRKDVLLQVPAAQAMEAQDKLPTGKLVPVAGTKLDLRKPTPLEGLDLDDVYFGLGPAAVPAFEWRDRGMRVTLGGSREFTHLVVYTPPGKPFFCVENQTSSTDAHNLHGRGLKKESHLIVLEKGKTARGHVDWKVRKAR